MILSINISLFILCPSFLNIEKNNLLIFYAFSVWEGSEKVCFKLKRPSNNAGLRPLFLKNRYFFGALSDTVIWNPSDLYKIDMPHEMLNKQKDKAVKQAIKLLTAEGIIKSSDISAA